ncbi:hypothetical protein KP509_12G040300 [Ceratopteris richardii]|uniref:Uncharacterized protein n=1 Tax=Ceratopteris richardii TaxID=49495 RepID=A0A8T2TNW3_CERRI|nr:hypothetical protein KP509_12G040300 [Ceratopteris richardii]
MFTISTCEYPQNQRLRNQGHEARAGSGENPDDASLVQKQQQMRGLIAQRLPKADLCSVSSSIDYRFGVLHPEAPIVRVATIAQSCFKNVFVDESWEQLEKVKKLQTRPSSADHVTTNNELEASVDALKQKGKTQVIRRAKSQHRFKLKVGNASLKRLLSGAFAGAVSRTAVAPLETIRTHLMVGSGGHTVQDVFEHIMHNEGWQGLFRGNGVNVIRVAPSKAIELFAYDTIKKAIERTPTFSRIPLPPSSIAGATAGVCSTLCTYPLELLKTRLTIQRGVYKNLADAFIQICQQEGPRELYRGLTPSLIGVVPYAATNYFAYDFLKRLYKRLAKQEQVGNLPTLLIGSAAGAFASAATFPLEVARKQMQVGALTGRPVYDNVFHALASLLEKHGPIGLYRGLGASCIKLIPAAGISFMCYEAFKKILIEENEVG